MSRMQKFAWFNLAVLCLTAALVVALWPFLGQRALGGLGCLGFIGLGPLFFRKQAGKVLTDERDHLIQGRSVLVAYALFWVVFVLAAVVLAPLVYGQEGAVPVSVLQISVFAGFMFFYAVMSTAILVQYAGGTRDAE